MKIAKFYKSVQIELKIFKIKLITSCDLILLIHVNISYRHFIVQKR